MIRVFLRGGLGNQMFQYALGLELAKKNNTPLFLDATFLNDRTPRRQFTYRSYDLDVFDISPNFATFSKISSALPIPGVWLGMDIALMEVRRLCGQEAIIKEKDEYHFYPEVFSVRGNAVLWGRWQSEKYFTNVVSEIKNEFGFKKEFSDGAKILAQTIKETQSVSIHVRRGDYIAFSNMKKIVGDTDLSYYSRAISYIAERFAQPHFFVFSDDIEWCRKNLSIPFAATYVDPSTAGYKSIQHMQLMALCKHNIIANSTFSWWGAWLNENPGKIVLAPKQWVQGVRDDDVVPTRWIRI